MGTTGPDEELPVGGVAAGGAGGAAAGVGILKVEAPLNRN